MGRETRCVFQNLNVAELLSSAELGEDVEGSAGLVLVLEEDSSTGGCLHLLHRLAGLIIRLHTLSLSLSLATYTIYTHTQITQSFIEFSYTIVFGVSDLRVAFQPGTPDYHKARILVNSFSQCVIMLSIYA